MVAGAVGANREDPFTTEKAVSYDDTDIDYASPFMKTLAGFNHQMIFKLPINEREFTHIIVNVCDIIVGEGRLPMVSCSECYSEWFADEKAVHQYWCQSP